MNEHQQPEGQLIADALTRLRLSARQGAKGTGISDTRLRHIAKGYQPVGRGQVIEVVAPADTLARIADRLGITADQLRGAGRDDAAEILTTSTARTHGVGVVLDMGRYERALESLSDWMADDTNPEQEIHPPTEGLWLWTPGQLSDALGEQTSALERAFADSIHEHMSALARGRRPFNDQPEESENRGGDPAPTNHAGASPAQDVTVEDGEVVDDPEAEPDPRPATGRPRRRRDG